MKLFTGLAACLWLCASATAVNALTDPTRPNGNASTLDNGDGWQLTATRITPQRRAATINGIEVIEGGLIGSARVLRIRHAQVDLDAQGEILTLHLLPARMKQVR
jgi:hypothetical protein